MMTAAQHDGLAGGRWKALSLVEQLANVGSEVERALRARERGQSERADRAFTRALELFDLTAADDRWRGSARREVLRAREEFCRDVLNDAPDSGNAEYLRRYFLEFAVAARAKRP